MKVLKKFWFMLVAMMPISSGAMGPFVLGGLAIGAGIVGVSIWRSLAPVNMAEALDFFSSCWSCQIFSDIMMSMSTLLPGVYKALGKIVIPMSATLLGVLVAWRITAGFLNNKIEDASKIVGNFSSYVVKLTILIGLLVIPLPRLITNVFIEPALTIGTSFDYVVSDNDAFSECMVATAISDPVSASPDVAGYGAFSPKLRHQLACEIANVHQITGLGMTVGWTIMNMAFNTEYMHKFLEKVPFFPNVPLAAVGLLILALFFYALLPIPLYFLEIFINLSMDLIMLPLMLMAWMFDDDEFKIFPQGGRTIRQMIDDVVKAMVGVALTVVFLTFAVMFLNKAFGDWGGVDSLMQVINNPDSQIAAKFLMDGIMMQNNSLIIVVLMGIFIAMFMTMIPQLINMLFNVKISDKYYKTIKNDMNLIWGGLKKWGSAIKK